MSDFLKTNTAPSNERNAHPHILCNGRKGIFQRKYLPFPSITYLKYKDFENVNSFMLHFMLYAYIFSDSCASTSTTDYFEALFGFRFYSDQIESDVIHCQRIRMKDNVIVQHQYTLRFWSRPLYKHMYNFAHVLIQLQNLH